MNKSESANWILKTTSARFSAEAYYMLNTEQGKGMYLIPMFLNTILFDSCSQEVRDIFVGCLLKQFVKLESVTKDAAKV